MKIGKTICCVALGALVLSAIPYQFKKDEETGTLDVRSLLWGLKKTPGEDHFSFAIPASGLDEDREKEDEALTKEALTDEASES